MTAQIAFVTATSPFTVRLTASTAPLPVAIGSVTGRSVGDRVVVVIVDGLVAVIAP